MSFILDNWQWLSGIAALVAAWFGKMMYDNKLRQDGRLEVEDEIYKQRTKRQLEYHEAAIRLGKELDSVVRLLPGDWDTVERLRKQGVQINLGTFTRDYGDSELQEAGEKLQGEPEDSKRS